MKKPRSRAVFLTSITEDIAMDILLKLPVKPLLRFKCISKSWYSLISDPSFIKLHLQYSNNHQKLIVPISYPNQKLHLNLYDLISREEIALPYEYIEQHHPELYGATILCSCNGLLLLGCYYGKTEHIIVLNPLTRESRELPKVDNSNYAPPTADYILGYDSSTDDYNVIRYAYDYPDVFNSSLRSDLMVFSLKKSTCWRKIIDFMYLIILKDCINLNGALHWLQRPAASALNAKKKIVSFTLSEETIMEMELPYNDANNVIWLQLSIWQGCLCLSETISLHPHRQNHNDLRQRRYIKDVALNVWLMKEYGSWTKFITIPHLLLIDPRRKISAPFSYMKKAIFIIKQGVGSMLVMYDLETKEFEINKWQRPKRYPYLVDAFVQSLVSPNCRVN